MKLEKKVRDKNTVEFYQEDKLKYTYYRNLSYECWKERDDKGNVIHTKDSYGVEWWKEYDDKGNEIHFKNSDGFEWWSDDTKTPGPFKFSKYE